MDLLKDLPEGDELEGILAGIEVQPDGGGGDSGGAPPPSLELRTEGRHNVLDEEGINDFVRPQMDFRNQSFPTLDAEPEPSVLLER